MNDFDIDEEEIAIENREDYLQKIEKRVSNSKIEASPQKGGGGCATFWNQK